MALRFYLARLKHASRKELLHRAREFFFNLRLSRQWHRGHLALPVPEVREQVLRGLQLPDMAGTRLPGSEDGVVHGIDGGDRREDEGRFRGVPFSRVKTSMLSCDLRALWEPARLQQCVAADAVDPACVFAWLEENPFPLGLHYMSVMECGLRIPVFVRCLKTAELGEERRRALAKAIFEHAWLIQNRLSLHSSLGNHTVAECVGLVFAGGVFQESGEGRAWLEQGVDLLHQELFHQILPDGGPAEQSLSYHRFVLDLYWLAVDFLESNGFHDCAAWKSRLESGENFLGAFMDARGVFPAIGDSDDGHAIAPGLAPRRHEPELCTVGVTTFPESGYTVVRQQSGVILTVDHGPLGMAPLFNHGHADALSFTLGLRGTAFFIDPGTYRYNGVPKERQYFKGTRSHNTVTVDGQDQARQLTSFIWDSPYEAGASLHESVGLTEISGWHDGYTRLASPVVHRRTFRVTEGRIEILDSFLGRGIHDFDLHMHLHPDVQVVQQGMSLVLQRDGVALDVRFETQGRLDFVRGQEEPFLGWYSPAYGLLEPTTTVRLSRTGLAADVRFKTIINLRAQ
jgi:hypothetical protein